MPDEESGAQRRTIHIRIRDLRRERSLTQEELAAALGLSRQSINAMEAGRNLPSLPVAMQIASFFSVPVHAIFGGDIEGAPQAHSGSWPSLREAFNDLMEENVAWAPVQSAPTVNIWQTAHTVEVEVRLAGYAKDEIQIEVGEDFLTVASDAVAEPAREYFRREFARQPFSRTVALPALVRSDDAEAVMKNGVLNVTIPKIVEEKPKTARIAIKSDE